MAKKYKKRKSSTTISTFVEAIRQEHNLGIVESENIVRTFLKVIEDSLVEEKDVVLKRIGTFHVVHQEERVSLIPKTAQKILLSERNTLKFESSRTISDLINQKHPKTFKEITEEEAEKLSKKKSRKKDLT